MLRSQAAGLSGDEARQGFSAASKNIVTAIEAAYPLSPMQRDMLLHSMSSPGSGAYVQHAICDLRESLEPSLLERAWQRVVERHSILDDPDPTRAALVRALRDARGALGQDLRLPRGVLTPSSFARRTTLCIVTGSPA